MSERAASGLSPSLCQLEPITSFSTLITGFFILLGRIVGIQDIISVRILFLAVISLSAGLLWLITLRLSGNKKASLIALFSVLALPEYIFQGVMGCQSKTMLIFLILLMLLNVEARRLFWAGFCASLAFLTWQPSLMIFGCLIFILLFQQEQKVRKIIISTIGFLVPIIPYTLYFILTGSLIEHLEQAFYFTAVFVPRSFSGIFYSLFELACFWSSGCGKFNILPLFFAYGIIKLFLQAWRSDKGLISYIRQNPAFSHLYISALLIMAFTYYDHQGFPDLTVIFPFMLVITAITLGQLIDGFLRFSKLESKRAKKFILPLLLLLLTLPSLIRGLTYKESLSLLEQQSLSQEVKNFLDDGETVYAIGCSHLLAFCHADNWLVYCDFLRGVDQFLQVKTGHEIFIPYKDDKLPTIILFASYRRPPRDFKKWILNLYDEITTPEFSKQKIRVFKLKKN